jgi:hypothetical protein
MFGPLLQGLKSSGLYARVTLKKVQLQNPGQPDHISEYKGLGFVH